MTDWLIDIIPQACPPDVMDAPEAYRAAWGRYVGEAVPGDGDPEDWREQAARLEAATVLLQCLFDRFGSVFPQCGLMVFPGVVIVSR